MTGVTERNALRPGTPQRGAGATVARIAAGDREAIRPYLAEARRLWHQRKLVLFDTGAPDGSLIATTLRQAGWVAADLALAAEAARQGESPEHVLNAMLAARMMTVCAGAADFDEMPAGEGSQPDIVRLGSPGGLHVLPELVVTMVGRELASRPYDHSLAFRLRLVRKGAAHEPPSDQDPGMPGGDEP